MNEKIKKFTESVMSLTNRQKLSITGVEKVFSVNENKIFLQASGASVKISGEKLDVEKLDVENGLLRVSGLLSEIKYDEKKIPLLKRLFK